MTRGAPPSGGTGWQTPQVAVGVTSPEEVREDERRVRAPAFGVRVSVLGATAVSYGVGVRPTTAYVRRAATAGIPAARRTSGGTGVLHLEGDIAWSVVLPRGHPAVGTDFIRAYGRIGGGLVRWLGAQGVDAEWVPAPGVDPDYCVLSGRGEVLAARGRILGGAAQHLTGRALLHQGMIARRVDRRLVRQLFAIEDEALLDRLVGLDELGVTTPSPDAAREIAAELGREFSGRPV
jgi:lipoate-protein ligase A